MSRARFTPLWWVSDRDGQVALAQPPNPALVVWIVCVVVGWTSLLSDERATIVSWVGTGALVVWSLDEVLRGTSPARRVLGTVVFVVELLRIFQ